MSNISLKEDQHKLIQHLESGDYSSGYIRRIAKEIQVILQMRERGTWVSYEERYNAYCEGVDSPTARSNQKSLLSVIAKFETQGIYPGVPLGPGQFRRSYFQEDPLKALSPEFQDVISNFVSTGKSRGLKNSTMIVSLRNVSLFFRHVQNLGISTLREVREEHVLGFFRRGNVQRHGYIYKRHVKNALTAYAAKCPESLDVASFLPDSRWTRKVIQYLTDAEIEKIKSALHDQGNALDHRDRAVGILLMHTGIRSCDLANLKMEDIHLGKGTISFIQQKTGVAVVLPLRPVVRDSILDYVTLERPRVKGGCLFLSKRKRYKGISACVVSKKICGHIYDAAGVRMGKGDRRGAHLFRYHLATKLLGNDVPKMVITRVLGQEDPESVEAYLAADFKHLKTCALDISMFPIREEVFDV